MPALRLQVALLCLASASLAAPAPSWSGGPRPANVGPELIVELVARGFFRALLGARLADAAAVCAPRVRFEDRWVAGESELRQELSRLIDRAVSGTLRLRRVEVLSYREMVRRFGPPPARLRQAVRDGDMVALARFDRQGAVAVLRRDGRFWRVVALTD